MLVNIPLAAIVLTTICVALLLVGTMVESLTKQEWGEKVAKAGLVGIPICFIVLVISFVYAIILSLL